MSCLSSLKSSTEVCSISVQIQNRRMLFLLFQVGGEGRHKVAGVGVESVRHEMVCVCAAGGAERSVGVQ